MIDAQQDQNKAKPERYEDAQALDISLLPDLCSAASVLSLVIIGELLALALVLSAQGIRLFSWQDFGLTSFLIQWVILSSAGTLCTFRTRLNRLTPTIVVTASYIIVLLFTGIYSVIGLTLMGGIAAVSFSSVVSNLVIAAIFAGVLMRYLYLQRELKQREQAALSARIQALQSRIRPHFLFNSLNSIASLIAIKPQAAEKMVVDLSQLFRGSLKLPSLTSMSQEVALCQCFIDIEKVRLGSRLEVEWTIGSDLGEAKILNLLLQPLLENAIYHGIQPLPTGGVVTVNIKLVENDIVIKISNPRLPGEPAVTRHMSTTESRGNGIALANIRHRLNAYYGKSAYLRIVKGEADFSAIMRYPLKQ